MRKIILLVVCTFYMLSVHAQLTQKAIDQMFKTTWNPQKNKVGIWDDAVNSDGFRQVCGVHRVTNSTTPKSDLFIGMVALGKGDDVVYRVNFFTWRNFAIHVKEDSPFLIKLGDDSRMDCVVTYANDDLLPIVRSAMGVTVTLYPAIISFDVTDEQMQELSKGIKKVRYEVNNNVEDLTLKKDNISAFLVEEYNYLKEIMSKERHFDDGF